MAYRFRQDEDFQDGLRRIAGEEMHGVVLALQETRAVKQAQAVHEARRRIKKVRALLRLTCPAAPKLQRQENRALRDVGRQLSALRDAGVFVETFDGLLTEQHSGGDTPIAASVHRELVQYRSRVEKELGIGRVMARAKSAAEAIAGRVPEWSCGEAGQGNEALAMGFAETYRRGRKAMRRAAQEQDVDVLHDWRKRAKDHWFQLRLLAGRHPGITVAMAAEARKLEQALGDDHNLTLLVHHLSANSQCARSGPSLRALVTLAGERQNWLRGEAQRLGLQVYSLRTKDWQKSWHTQRKNAA